MRCRDTALLTRLKGGGWEYSMTTCWLLGFNRAPACWPMGLRLFDTGSHPHRGVMEGVTSTSCAGCGIRYASALLAVLLGLLPSPFKHVGLCGTCCCSHFAPAPTAAHLPCCLPDVDVALQDILAARSCGGGAPWPGGRAQAILFQLLGENVCTLTLARYGRSYSCKGLLAAEGLLKTIDFP